MKLSIDNFAFVKPIKTVLMKKYFILVLMAFIGLTYANANILVEDDDTEDVFMEIRKKTFPTDEFERSLDMFVVEAEFNASTNEVSVLLHNIGTANVYVVDALGAIVSQSVVETDSPVSVTLSAALCSGSFYVVVDAAKVYSEGVVTR